MAKNDKPLVDLMLQERQKNGYPSSDIGEVFELFAFEQVLKEYDLSKEKLEDGWVDGSLDGGIDGVYVFVNGNLYSGQENFIWPRKNADLTICILTCKHADDFRQAPLDAMYPTLRQFWDLSIPNETFASQYSEDLSEVRERYVSAMSNLALSSPRVEVRFIYACRGDTANIGASIQNRMNQLEGQAHEFLGDCEVAKQFVGASELLTLSRKRKDESLSIPVVAQLVHDGDNYVVIVRLEDYYKFVSDGEGMLRRYLFDSNVRDYLGLNEVNLDIDNTLKNPGLANFWWLNNGVTIIGSGARMSGGKIHIDNVQIVNGLQTTETIFRHFSSGLTTSANSNLMVKILTTTDESVRDAIIQATNNQSAIAKHTLHATEKIQRDIEDILARNEFFYERRPGYYKNKGKPKNQSIPPVELASALIGMVYKNPFKAYRLKSKFMQSEKQYSQIFSDGFSLRLWPILTRAYLRAKDYVFMANYKNPNVAKLAVQLTPVLCLSVLAKRFGKFDYSTRDILSLDASFPSQADFETILKHVPFHMFGRKTKINRTSYRQVAGVFLRDFAAKFKIPYMSDIGKWELISSDTVNGSNDRKDNPSTELIDKVNRLLPQQPWPRGIDEVVAKALKVRRSLVCKAIDKLISQGRWKIQRDGIIYDDTGKAILVDTSRTDLSVEDVNQIIAGISQSEIPVVEYNGIKVLQLVERRQVK